MKKILLIVLTLSTSLTLFAQRQMHVWQDGMPTSFAVAEVDSVTFEEHIDPNVKQLLGVWEGRKLYIHFSSLCSLLKLTVS